MQDVADITTDMSQHSEQPRPRLTLVPSPLSEARDAPLCLVGIPDPRHEGRQRPSRGQRSGLLAVTPAGVRVFRDMAGVHLVPLHEGYALVSVEAGTTLADVELRIRDVLDDMPKGRPRNDVEAVLGALASLRRSRAVRVVTQSFLVVKGAASRSASTRGTKDST